MSRVTPKVLLPTTYPMIVTVLGELFPALDEVRVGGNVSIIVGINDGLSEESNDGAGEGIRVNGSLRLGTSVGSAIDVGIDDSLDGAVVEVVLCAYVGELDGTVIG